MVQPQDTQALAQTEEAITVLFCLIDDAYAHLNPYSGRYESLKRLSDSEVVALALLQQLRGVQSCRSFLRDAARFFSHLFSGRGRALSFLVPSTCQEAQGLFGAPAKGDARRAGGRPADTADRLDAAFGYASQRSRSIGGLRRGGLGKVGIFSVYGVKLHLVCATNRVPLSYELTPANVADVSLSEELLAEAELGEDLARRVLGDLAYRSKELKEELAKAGIVLVTEPSERRRGVRQHIEIAISSLKRVFGLGETLATTLVGLATRIAAKICAYTYAFLVNRRLDRPQGCIKELWA
jgi:hypothetical protein